MPFFFLFFFIESASIDQTPEICEHDIWWTSWKQFIVNRFLPLLPSPSQHKKERNKCKCLIFNLAFVLVPVLRAIFFCWSKSLYMLCAVCVCVNRRIKYVSCLRWVCVCVVNNQQLVSFISGALATKTYSCGKRKRIYNVLEHFTLSRVRSTAFTFFRCVHSLYHLYQIN